jgi:tripartite ATP-independent transporter DctM subunit
MLLLIYLGMHVGIVLALISFIGVWVIRGDLDTAVFHLWAAASKSISDSVFAVVPLYILMGSLAGIAGMGRDTYDLAQRLIGRVRGSLGIATVLANAIFAAVTGVSVASASIFAKLSVPEMMRHGYRAQFAVGVVAGSSILGMLIPPSVLMIVYGIIAEQSIGDLFIAGVGPGVVMVLAFSALILIMAYRFPSQVMASGSFESESRVEASPAAPFWRQAGPIVILVSTVMGGIYSGIFTPIEAAAVGSLVALFTALAKRTLTWHSFGQVLLETGNVTAVVLFMIVGASMYSRMLGVSGLPTEIGTTISGMSASYELLIAIYVAIVIALGTLIDSVSIMLIMVPLFSVILAPYNVDMLWFGIVTIIAAEIGLLTPPFGLSAFVVHSTLARADIPLKTVFLGSAYFAATMLAVLLLLIAFPPMATYLVEIRR